MKISNKVLARVCVALLVLYPVSAILVWAAYPTRDDYYGILAALLAANAGTAFFVRLVFGAPEFSDYTSGALRRVVLTHISHINPARRVVNSTIATRCSRIAEHSAYHEC